LLRTIRSPRGWPSISRRHIPEEMLAGRAAQLDDLEALGVDG
jgi:hypothetical protein